VIRKGKMKAYKQLFDAEVKALVGYVRLLQEITPQIFSACCRAWRP
jgi:hypothetical protein